MFACIVVLAVCALSLSANWLAPSGYAKQFRDAPSSPPSRQHWLGTDDIGRDRFARVLYGTRISLLLAPAAALVSTALAALVESTRADAAHPNNPRIRKVMRTETSGETLSGISARTVIRRKSQGKERNKSVKPRAMRSQMPPR